MMKRLLIAVLLLLIAVAVYLLVKPIPIDPVAWTPGANPGMTGPFAEPGPFIDLANLIGQAGQGPEDVTRGPDGFFYTGLQDGRVVRFREDGPAETVVNTGGRPLGMQFDAQGNLIIADAFKGLLSLAPDRSWKVLTESAEGVRFLFTDDLDIARDGTIWFSDASQRFDQHRWILDFWEGRATGRLISYRPATGETKVHLRDLQFANGVALGPDEEYVLVNETIPARISRYWLKGPKAGSRDIFLDGLPGHPDNLSYNGKGIFWVAMAAPRLTTFEKLAGWPKVRAMLFRLPESWRQIEPEPLAWTIGVEPNGRIKYNLQDRSGNYTNITSVNEFDGRLYFGSIYMTSVGRVKAP